MTMPGPQAPVKPDETQALMERLKAAEAKIAELVAEKAEHVEIVAKKLPEHWLHLANGDVVESAGAIPTHVAVDDKVVPVVHAYER
jgi:ABC-type nitrate/sulfonate/bicarbonate transport system substrate-binding protein